MPAEEDANALRYEFTRRVKRMGTAKSIALLAPFFVFVASRSALAPGVAADLLPLVGLVAAAVGYAVFRRSVWRCPRCEAPLGWGGDLMYCDRCICALRGPHAPPNKPLQ